MRHLRRRRPHDDERQVRLDLVCDLRERRGIFERNLLDLPVQRRSADLLSYRGGEVDVSLPLAALADGHACYSGEYWVELRVFHSRAPRSNTTSTEDFS